MSNANDWMDDWMDDTANCYHEKWTKLFGKLRCDNCGNVIDTSNGKQLDLFEGELSLHAIMAEETEEMFRYYGCTSVQYTLW